MDDPPIEYNIEYIYLTGVFPLLSSLFFIDSKYKVLVGSICFYLVIEWLNSRFLDIRLDGLISYTSFIGMFLRSLMIISFLISYQLKIRHAKYVAYSSLMIILVYHLYEGIMIRIGTDDVEYDSLGNRSYLSKKSLNIILGLIMGVIGSIFRFKGLFSPADIILLFIGGALIVYSLLFVDSSDNYDIRKRASSSEFYQRKDLSSGIYS